MNQIVSNVSDEGNTKSSSAPRIRARRWCFTLNNPNAEEKSALSRMSQCLIIGDEVGKCGTPHLQGYVEFENQKDFDCLKKLCPRAHWEKAKGSKQKNIDYCSKEKILINTLFSEKEKKEDLIRAKKMRILESYKNIEWKNWQKQIIDILEGPKNDRVINWVFEKNGNVGKTFLCRYIYMKYSCVLGTGKKTDVAFAIKTFLDENDQKDPDVIILDIPRTNIDYVNYSMLEKLKDGLFSNGKYESCDIFFEEIPHLFCFANEPPNYENVSQDRWNIINIS